MSEHRPARLSRSADVGRLVAEGRRRIKLSQTEFAQRLGISRKTLSDLERGAAEHVSLRTALQALALAGFTLEASARRAPSLSEVMAQRAAHQARVDRLENASDQSHAPLEDVRNQDRLRTKLGASQGRESQRSRSEDAAGRARRSKR